jgi:glycine/D-amino acid oxidase-like deaminating enzyme
MRVVICGGGVIGACLANFLSQRQVDTLVVERIGVACAASGKSGGFLALDWCDGSPLEELARRSFALHAELGERNGERTGYRRLDTLSVVAGDRLGPRSGRNRPAWLADQALVHRKLGTAETTAQIHPALFTQTMMDLAIEQGVRLRKGAVDGLALDGSRVTGAIVDGEVLAADAVVIAMGPWSVLASQWLPLPAVHGLKSTSLVFRTDPPILSEALFVEVDEDGEARSPEVFPRGDGTTYVCGYRSHEPLPVDPAQVTPGPGTAEALLALTRRFSPALADAEILATQACYRPVTQDGLPLMGAVPGIRGAFVSTGHSVWGMLNGPASGEAMAELITDGRSRIDLTHFDPGRLPRLRLRDGA